MSLQSFSVGVNSADQSYYRVERTMVSLNVFNGQIYFTAWSRSDVCSMQLKSTWYILVEIFFYHTWYLFIFFFKIAHSFFTDIYNIVSTSPVASSIQVISIWFMRNANGQCMSAKGLNYLSFLDCHSIFVLRLELLSKYNFFMDYIQKK